MDTTLIARQKIQQMTYSRIQHGHTTLIARQKRQLTTDSRIQHGHTTLIARQNGQQTTYSRNQHGHTTLIARQKRQQTTCSRIQHGHTTLIARQERQQTTYSRIQTWTHDTDCSTKKDNKRPTAVRAECQYSSSSALLPCVKMKNRTNALGFMDEVEKSENCFCFIPGTRICIVLGFSNPPPPCLRLEN